MGGHGPPKSLAIKKGDQPIVLRGDSTLTKVEGALKKLMKAREEEEQWSWIEVEGEEKAKNKSREGGDEEWLHGIQALLKQYDNMFDTPRRLPQNRTIDHRLLMLEGNKTINVRHHISMGTFRKGRVRIGNRRVASRNHRPRRNSYSCSVFLVKKKKGRWCSRVDYCRWNQITMSYKLRKKCVENKKCVISHSKVQHMEQRMVQKGVETDEKDRARENWPPTKNVPELRGLLRLSGYYGRFVKKYGDMATPLFAKILVVPNVALPL